MSITQNGSLKRDDNDNPVMGGTSSADNTTIINAAFDPVTRRLLTDAAAGSFDLTISDGVTSVSNVDSVTFDGATVTDDGGGSITVEITAGAGDVVGPASSTDNALPRFDGVTGILLQNSGVIVDDTNNITGAGNYGGTGATLSSLTASELLATDASKNLVSLAVATYPSLTELTYLKGVTSAIQTQLDAKQATITFGTGVLAALGVNIGSAGAPVLFNGALGTPSSGTVTNLTGTASININGTVGATTPTTATFTTATLNTGLVPDANDGAFLGTALLSFSDLFLASGGVINWNNGTVTITQASDLLTLAGDLGISGLLTVTEGGANYSGSFRGGFGLQVYSTDTGASGPTIELYHDSASPAASDIIGIVNFYGEDSAGNKQQYAGIKAIAENVGNSTEVGNLTFSAASLGSMVDVVTIRSAQLNPASNNGSALGSTSLQWSDLFLAEGGVINWDNGDLTLTQTGNELALGGGNLDIGINTLRIAGDIDIDGTPTTDDTWTGPSVNSFNAGATIAQWEAVYLDSSSTWQLTDADAIATAGTVMIGLATAAGTASNPLRVTLAGSFVRNDAWAWTVGGPIYLSTTAGALTQTAPSATDDVVRICGYAVNADTIFWNPSNDFITIV